MIPLVEIITTQKKHETLLYTTTYQNHQEGNDYISLCLVLFLFSILTRDINFRVKITIQKILNNTLVPQEFYWDFTNQFSSTSKKQKGIFRTKGSLKLCTVCVDLHSSHNPMNFMSSTSTRQEFTDRHVIGFNEDSFYTKPNKDSSSFSFRICSVSNRFQEFYLHLNSLGALKWNSTSKLHSIYPELMFTKAQHTMF